MIAFIFPGQGSQQRGMGRDLFDRVPEYARVERQVDELLGYSLRRLCVEDPENLLGKTQYTQPALYMVNALSFYDSVSTRGMPQFVAGHSLGEYNALLAAGAFDLLTGLRLVKERGALMAKARDGGMAAVVGLEASRIAQVIQENRLAALDVANFNTPKQTVVSGPVEEIRRAGPLFERAGAQMFMPLQVSAAFHSRYMAAAAREFDSFLQQFTFNAPRVPVIANVTAKPYPSNDPSRTIRSLLVEQITGSVQWVNTIAYLRASRVTEFSEVGPGTVLTRLVQQNGVPAPLGAPARQQAGGLRVS